MAAMDHFANDQIERQGTGSMDGEHEFGLIEDEVDERNVSIPALGDDESAEAAKLLTRREHVFSSGDEQGGIMAQVQTAFRNLCTVCEWGPALTKEKVKADLIAGVTVGVMVIPQSMSYAGIAGLPYVYGMYSAFVPTLIYAFVGGSRQLAVGPVAMVSLLVADGLSDVLTYDDCPDYWDNNPDNDPINEVCPDEYVKLAVITSLLVGLVQLAGGFFQVGFLVTFLGHPVVSGFTSGAAIIIGLSQVKYIVGFDIEKSQYVYVTLVDLFSNLDKIKYMSVILGLLCLAALWLMREYLPEKNADKYGKLKPLGPLIVCVIGIALMAAVPQLEEDFNVSIVGKIPDGFPPLSIGDWDGSKFNAVLGTAVSASLIGYMESIAIGKSLASKHSYELHAGQEMFALGLANLVGAAMSCYPVTGSFSRSAVNNATGAQTQLAGLITAVIMFLTLMLLTPVFFYLPKFVLAAIVMNSVKNLVAVDDAKSLYKFAKKDFGLWMFAFLGTLFLGIQLALVLSVTVSLVIVIYQSVRPQMQVLWRLKGHEIYRNVKQESDGYFIPGCLIVRIGAPMYFANSGYVKDMILKYVADMHEIYEVKYIIIEMTPVISVDSTAVHVLEDLHKDVEKRGMKVALCNVGTRVMPVFEASGLRQVFGASWIVHRRVHDAVVHCMRHQATVKLESHPLSKQHEGSDINLLSSENGNGLELSNMESAVAEFDENASNI